MTVEQQRLWETGHVSSTLPLSALAPRPDFSGIHHPGMGVCHSPIWILCAELASREGYAVTLPNLTGSHSTLACAWSPWRWLPCSVIRSTSTHWAQIADCELYLGSKDNGTWPCSEVSQASPSFSTDFWPESYRGNHLPGGCSNTATNTTDATRDIKSTLLLRYPERKKKQGSIAPLSGFHWNSIQIENYYCFSFLRQGLMYSRQISNSLSSHGEPWTPDHPVPTS